MMQKTAISTRQVFFLATPLLVIMGHFNMVPIFLGWAGKDVWIGVVAGFLLGSVIFAAMARLQKKFYGNTLIEEALAWCGPWLGRLLTLPIILYFFVMSVITMYAFSTFIGSAFSLNYPQWVITLTFTMLTMYMVHKGIEVIARVSEWIIVYNIITGIMVSLSLMNKKEYGKLLPMLEHGIQPLIPVALGILATFGELIVMLMVNVQRKDPEKSISYGGVYTILFLVNLIISPATSISPVAIFGEKQAQHLTYPVESAVRLINLGFIERFDIYGLTIMTVSSSLRLALLHYGASVGLAQWLSLKNYRWVNLVLGAGLLIAALTSFKHYIQFYDFLETYYPYGVIACGLILLIWLLSYLPFRKKLPQKNGKPT